MLADVSPPLCSAGYRKFLSPELLPCPGSPPAGSAPSRRGSCCRRSASPLVGQLSPPGLPSPCAHGCCSLRRARFPPAAPALTLVTAPRYGGGSEIKNRSCLQGGGVLSPQPRVPSAQRVPARLWPTSLVAKNLRGGLQTPRFHSRSEQRGSAACSHPKNVAVAIPQLTKIPEKRGPGSTWGCFGPACPSYLLPPRPSGEGPEPGRPPP